MENKDIRSPDTVVIHIGTNDLRRSVNLDFVMGDMYALVNTAKSKFLQSRLLLRHRDVSWRY